MQVEVTIKQIENISGGVQNYIVIQTDRGKVFVSIGEKNYTKLAELLKDTVKNQEPKKP